jgi:hypothetical protein
MAATPKQNPGASRGGIAKVYAELEQRHCERSEAIHRATRKQEWIRFARNDGSGLFEI